jgi:hypothetical protein
MRLPKRNLRSQVLRHLQVNVTVRARDGHEGNRWILRSREVSDYLESPCFR